MKNSVIYECSNCGAQSKKWQGQCGECGKWNTLEESVSTVGQRSKVKVSNHTTRLLSLSEVEGKVGERATTGISEMDRVLGGGLVAGEVVLMVGEPGIGKSTLLTQLSLNMSNVVYVCGEESPGQVKIRVDRMMKSSKINKSIVGLKMLAEMDVDTIISSVNKESISLLIIDSVQTLYTSDLPGLAGSVSQIRECTGRIIAYAKSKNVPVILVGHVTKDGEMAGPKVLEHMVDAVLELTGDRYYDLRLLRTQKNRFGHPIRQGFFRAMLPNFLKIICAEFLSLLNLALE